MGFCATDDIRCRQYEGSKLYEWEYDVEKAMGSLIKYLISVEAKVACHVRTWVSPCGFRRSWVEAR
jgi:hypothetical protein